jgi:hypothetical protein
MISNLLLKNIQTNPKELWILNKNVLMITKFMYCPNKEFKGRSNCTLFKNGSEIQNIDTSYLMQNIYFNFPSPGMYVVKYFDKEGTEKLSREFELDFKFDLI